MNRQNRVDQAAVDAHHRGLTWGEFFQAHREQFDKLPAADRQQAVERALQIVATGETAGMVPVANSMFGWDEVSEGDVDVAPVPVVSDTETRARVDWGQIGLSTMRPVDHEAIAPAGPRASRQGRERTTRCGR
jgi:hypothetical protein